MPLYTLSESFHEISRLGGKKKVYETLKCCGSAGTFFFSFRIMGLQTLSMQSYKSYQHGQSHHTQDLIHIINNHLKFKLHWIKTYWKKLNSQFQQLHTTLTLKVKIRWRLLNQLWVSKQILTSCHLHRFTPGQKRYTQVKFSEYYYCAITAFKKITKVSNMAGWQSTWTKKMNSPTLIITQTHLFLWIRNSC